MINWKKVAKHLFRSQKVWEAMWYEKCDERNELWYSMAKAAGTPLPSELHVSANDMVVFALKKIGADIPEHLNFPYQKSEAQARFEQLISCLKRGDKLEPVPYLFSPWKIKLIQWLLK